MIKKPTITKVKNKLWLIFSEYIRKRDCLRTTGCADWGLCITCGRRYHYKLLQAGHFVAGRQNAGLFSEKGTHAQCYNCNINLKGNTLEYRRKVIELYGVGADEELEIEARGIKQFKIFELEELITTYKQKLQSLKECGNTNGRIFTVCQSCEMNRDSKEE